MCTACAQVLNNVVTEPGRPAATREALAARLATGHRFCIINCWRNAGTDEVCARHGWHMTWMVCMACAWYGRGCRRVMDHTMDHTMHCGMQVRRAPLALYAAHYGGGGGGGSGGGGSGGGSSGGGRGGSSADGTGGGVGVTAQQQQKQPWAACFPEHTPDAARSRWYSFPAMQPDELLLFTQYGDIPTYLLWPH